MKKVVLSTILSLLLTQGGVQNGVLPFALRLVGVTAISSDSLVVEWLVKQDVANLAAELDYEVHVSTDKGFTPSSSTKKLTVRNASHGEITGLSAATKYYLAVVGRDESGKVCWSNQMAGTTASIPVVRTSTETHAFATSKDIQVTASTVSFKRDNEEELPKPGQVLVDADGGGLLRKVVSASEKNGLVTVATEPASLNEVYEQLEFSTNIRLENLETAAKSGTGIGLAKAVGGNDLKVQWPSGLTLMQSGRSTAKTVFKNGVQKSAGNGQLVTRSGKYMQVSMQQVNGAKPGADNAANALSIPLNDLWKSNISYCPDPGWGCTKLNVSPQVCGLRWTDVDHPDDARNRSFMKKVWTEGNPRDGYFLKFIPLEEHVDDELRPYEVDLEVDICPVAATVGEGEKLELDNIKIYVEKGDLALSPSNKEETFTDNDSDLTITNTTDLTFSPELDITARIKHAKLQYAHIKAKGNIELTQALHAVASGAAELGNTKLLFSSSFIKVIPTTIPVVVRGELEVYLKMEGIVQGQVDFKETFATSYTMEYGMQYDGSWKPVKDFENSFHIAIEGQAEAGLFAKVTLIPEIKLHFYEVVSGGMNLQPYLYADAGIEGHFDYQADYVTENFDMDYSLTRFEAGGGIDLSVFGGLEVFDINVISYPSDGSIDDRSTWRSFSPVVRTPFAGIPHLAASSRFQTSDYLEEDSRAVAVLGMHANVKNPLSAWGLGKEYYLYFSKWFAPKLVATESTCEGTFLGSEKEGDKTIFWFLPTKPGTCTVRLAGHSNLGWFARQTTETAFELVDADQDGMLDYWEDRFQLDDPNGDLDNDGFTNIEEFRNGTFPEKADVVVDDLDGDGLPDGWELQYGLNPQDPADAGGDLDGDGLTNLEEYLAGNPPMFIPPCGQPQASPQYSVIDMSSEPGGGVVIQKKVLSNVCDQYSTYVDFTDRRVAAEALEEFDKVSIKRYVADFDGNNTFFEYVEDGAFYYTPAYEFPDLSHGKMADYWLTWQARQQAPYDRLVCLPVDLTINNQYQLHFMVGEFTEYGVPENHSDFASCLTRLLEYVPEDLQYEGDCTNWWDHEDSQGALQTCDALIVPEQPSEYQLNATNRYPHAGTGSAVPPAFTLPASNSVSHQSINVMSTAGTGFHSIVAGASAEEIAAGLGAIAWLQASAETEVFVGSLSDDGAVSLTIGTDEGVSVISATVLTHDLSNMAASIAAGTGHLGLLVSVAGINGTELKITHPAGKDVQLLDFTHQVVGATIDVRPDSGMTSTLTSHANDSTVVAGKVILSSSNPFVVTSSIGGASGSIFNNEHPDVELTAQCVERCN